MALEHSRPSKATGTQQQFAVYREVRDAFQERIEHELLTTAPTCSLR
jgi:hypothetical protein